MAGALQPRRFGVWPLTTSFDLPPARRDNRGEEKVPMTAAEGRPHVRGDDGDEAGAGVTAGAKRREPRRGWRARGATRPPKEHPGDFEEDGQAVPVWSVRVAERPRGASTCARGERTPGWTNEAPRAPAIRDEVARRRRGGRLPQGAARRVGAGARIARRDCQRATCAAVRGPAANTTLPHTAGGGDDFLSAQPGASRGRLNGDSAAWGAPGHH
jgi:hypothetical protein